jgi:hypothetical protein
MSSFSPARPLRPRSHRGRCRSPVLDIGPARKVREFLRACGPSAGAVRPGAIRTGRRTPPARESNDTCQVEPAPVRDDVGGEPPGYEAASMRMRVVQSANMSSSPASDPNDAQPSAASVTWLPHYPPDWVSSDHLPRCPHAVPGLAFSTRSRHQPRARRKQTHTGGNHAQERVRCVVFPSREACQPYGTPDSRPVYVHQQRGPKATPRAFPGRKKRVREGSAALAEARTRLRAY